MDQSSNMSYISGIIHDRNSVFTDRRHHVYVRQTPDKHKQLLGGGEKEQGGRHKCLLYTATQPSALY